MLVRKKTAAFKPEGHLVGKRGDECEIVTLGILYHTVANEFPARIHALKQIRRSSVNDSTDRSVSSRMSSGNKRRKAWTDTVFPVKGLRF